MSSPGTEGVIGHFAFLLTLRKGFGRNGFTPDTIDVVELEVGEGSGQRKSIALVTTLGHVEYEDFFELRYVQSVLKLDRLGSTWLYP